MAEEHIKIDDSKVDEIAKEFIMPATVARKHADADESVIRMMLQLIGTNIKCAVEYGRTDVSYFVHHGHEPYINTVIAALNRQGYFAASRTSADGTAEIIVIKW